MHIKIFALLGKTERADTQRSILWIRLRGYVRSIRCGLLLQSERALSVCVFVCLFVGTVSPAETAVPIGVLFGTRNDGLKEPRVGRAPIHPGDWTHSQAAMRPHARITVAT